jgi:hypothetical protein
MSRRSRSGSSPTTRTAGRFTYEPVRAIPGFIARARTTWHVVAIGDRSSQVSFTATVTTRGIARPLMALAMRVQMARAGVHVLDDLRHYVEHGKPSPRKQRQLNRYGGEAPASPPIMRDRAAT